MPFRYAALLGDVYRAAAHKARDRFWANVTGDGSGHDVPFSADNGD